jgi:hypothetical protein
MALTTLPCASALASDIGSALWFKIVLTRLNNTLNFDSIYFANVKQINAWGRYLLYS